MTTTVEAKLESESKKRKSNADSIYIPANKRAIWNQAKVVAAQMGLSRSDLIMQLLSGVVALTPKTEGPAFKLKVESI
jgi:hypothetical protein